MKNQIIPYIQFGVVMNQKQNPLRDKSYAFALTIVSVYKKLLDEQKEYILSKQFVRSGTSIGANIEEANRAESKSDFIHKLSISLKEASETDYWLRLLRDSHFFDSASAATLIQDCNELISLLTASIKTARRNHNR
jgi:four helix bundle protein